MLILGLSFSVAAIGCGDDETTGTGGNGGTGGTPGACTNTADETIICEEGFPAAAQACGTSNLTGGADAIAMCIADDIGLSTECATCFGATTQCTIDNCLTDCGTDPLGDACTNCRATNCDPDFEACAGELAPCENGGGGNGGMGGSTM
jgi:hypothetical protein